MYITSVAAQNPSEQKPPSLAFAGPASYVLVGLRWGIYQSPDGTVECPHGYNDGNREQFRALFPEDGHPRLLVNTQLQREIASWYPDSRAEPFAFHEASGPTAYGLNLDGSVGHNDFTSPDGITGVDNQLYRVLGCIRNYRAPDGAIQANDDLEIMKSAYNRLIITLAKPCNPKTADDVSITVSRGMDPVPLDAAGKAPLPGGSQRIDTRWGAKYIQHLHGKFTHGVLTTDSTDLLFPWAANEMPTDEVMRAARLQLQITDTSADGIIAGYTDIERWYAQLMRSYPTFQQTYGQSSAPSIYKALHRLADAYPDPATGENTAISSALLASFIRTNLLFTANQYRSNCLSQTTMRAGPLQSKR